jgi:serine phosphatase RsbU (regulator of sigma subunit)
MTRRVAWSLSAAIVLLCGTLAAAQLAYPSRAVPTPVTQSQSAEHVTLGQSAVPLFGPWKFTVGDSPIDPKTGQPLWAEPDFDDSKWETVDLRPKDGSFNPVSGTSGYVPGWTTKGHPGYFGYAWYRIRVLVEVRQGEQLALAGPADVDDAYQVFDNGATVGNFGDFTGTKPRIYYAQPRMFPLPQTASYGARPNQTGPGESTRVLAFRLWMEPSTLIQSPEAGGMHSAPAIGEDGAVKAGYQMRWLETIRIYALSFVQSLLFGLLAVVAFSLILFDRSDHVYIWVGALFLLAAIENAIIVIGTFTELQSAATNTLLLQGLAAPLVPAAWVMVWRVWFGQKRPTWVPLLTVVLTLLLMTANILGYEIFFGLLPHARAVQLIPVSLVLRLLIFALLSWVVMEAIRRQGVEGWLVLPLVLLRGIGGFRVELGLLHIRNVWFPFGVQMFTSDVADLLVAVVIAMLLLRRLLKSLECQRLMALDVKQAQEVQQVILPESRLAISGMAIESEYRPAREVGGDFFQIIPQKTDGSLLIVAGDVTGKGLKAGMLVALLVGAIRSTSDWSTDPMVILKALNQRLIGRNDAQATCLALRITSGGEVTLCNAGHMAPYLNGEPIAMEGALPLGMIEDADFSVMRFQLKPDDKLVLMSDGIAEATDSEGHLFGFERVLELLRSAKSAAEVANAAQSFGQDDDISVIAVTRAPLIEPALASAD